METFFLKGKEEKKEKSLNRTMQYGNKIPAGKRTIILEV